MAIRPPCCSRVVTACSISAASCTPVIFSSTPRLGATASAPPPKCHVGGRLRMEQNEDASSPRADLLEQLQPLAPHRGFEIGESRGISAWPRQTLDEAAADRISNLHENDRDRAGFLLKRGEPGIALNQNDVRHRADQLRRVGSKAIDVAGDGARLDADVTTFRPPEPSQFLHERRDRFWTGLRGTQEHADPPHAIALLRAPRERPKQRRHRRRANEERDEIPPLHRNQYHRLPRRGARYR